MANFINISSGVPLHRTLLSPSSNSIASLPQLKWIHYRLGISTQRLLLFRVSCVSEKSNDYAEPKAEKPSPSSSSSSSPSPSPSPSSPSPPSSSAEPANNLAYTLCTVLGGLGFLETSYLTFLKLTNTEAFCPIGGGSCGSILNSEYSFVRGIPLPLIGMLAYGLVAALGLQLREKKMPFRFEKSDCEMILLGTTTSMAVASAYFLYILSTEFPGESCLYCLASAVLSFSLFFLTLKGMESQDIKSTLGLQLITASLVIITLSSSYSASKPVSTNLADGLPYFATEVKKESSPLALSLAKHLRSIGAKVYGAFWCTHCQDQKEMFGREAAKLLDYVECYPDGVGNGAQMANACKEITIEGFPTWVINGQVYSGEKQLSELAELAGLKLEDLDQSN